MRKEMKTKGSFGPDPSAEISPLVNGRAVHADSPGNTTRQPTAARSAVDHSLMVIPFALALCKNDETPITAASRRGIPRRQQHRAGTFPVSRAEPMRFELDADRDQCFFERDPVVPDGADGAISLVLVGCKSLPRAHLHVAKPSIMETAVQTYYVIPTDSPFRSLTSMAMSGWEFKRERGRVRLIWPVSQTSPKTAAVSVRVCVRLSRAVDRCVLLSSNGPAQALVA